MEKRVEIRDDAFDKLKVRIFVIFSFSFISSQKFTTEINDKKKIFAFTEIYYFTSIPVCYSNTPHFRICCVSYTAHKCNCSYEMRN